MNNDQLRALMVTMLIASEPGFMVSHTIEQHKSVIEMAVNVVEEICSNYTTLIV